MKEGVEVASLLQRESGVASDRALLLVLRELYI